MLTSALRNTDDGPNDGPASSNDWFSKRAETMPKPRGRHPHVRLTVASVRALSKRGLHADGNGLYLAIGPTGTKKWVLRTVVAGKRRDLAGIRGGAELPGSGPFLAGRRQA